MDKNCVIWLTGLSGAGKTTLATGLRNFLRSQGILAMLLDGDQLRKGINEDLGFTRNDRKENVRRIAEIARLLVEEGIVPVIAAISPYKDDRANARERLKESQFIEVYVKCSIEECERRDVKGLYKQARRKTVSNFTGISDVFEPPVDPEIMIDTEGMDYDSCLDELLQQLPFLYNQMQKR